MMRLQQPIPSRNCAAHNRAWLSIPTPHPLRIPLMEPDERDRMRQRRKRRLSSAFGQSPVLLDTRANG